MSEALADDIQASRAALTSAHDEVTVTLRLLRLSAEKVLALLDVERPIGALVWSRSRNNSPRRGGHDAW